MTGTDGVNAARQSAITVCGRGVGALAARRVAADNGLVVHLRPGPQRGAAPVVMLGEQAQVLLRDVFGADLFAGSHRITRRVVLWGADQPVTLPHQAIAVTGTALAAGLPEVADRLAPSDAAGLLTLHADDTSPDPRLRHFGNRQAAAAPVTLAPGADPAAVLVEATAAGWLFLIPLGTLHGWLLAVGGEPDALLGHSRLVAPAIAALGVVEARFQTAPRIRETLIGPDWLALGGAALAFDPICGDGTATATRGGILAAAVATAIAEGHDPAPLLRHYRAMSIAALRRHLAASLPFYRHGGQGDWWRAQEEAAAAGHGWCTLMLSTEPEPGFVLVGNRLVARAAAGAAA